MILFFRPWTLRGLQQGCWHQYVPRCVTASTHQCADVSTRRHVEGHHIDLSTRPGVDTLKVDVSMSTHQGVDVSKRQRVDASRHRRSCVGSSMLGHQSVALYASTCVTRCHDFCIVCYLYLANPADTSINAGVGPWHGRNHDLA